MVSLHPCKPPRAWVPPAGKLRGVHLLMSPASAGMQRSISTMQAQNSAYLVVPNAGVTSFPGLESGWKPQRPASAVVAQIEDLWDLFGI